jgi:hypothetical protein
MPSPSTVSDFEEQSAHELNKPSKWHWITYLLPLIVPLVVVGTYVIFYRNFLYCSANEQCSPLTSAEILAGISNTDQLKVSTYIAKASWTLINGVNVLASLVAIVTASIVIYQVLSENDKYKKIRWIIILFIVVLAADLSLFLALLTARDAYSPIQQLLRGTVGQALPSINTYMRFGDAFSFTGTLSLAVAACATLWRHDVKQELHEEHVVERVRLLRPVLYVGAVTLVVVLFRLSTTLGWAVSYLPADSELGNAVASFTTGIVATLGTVFTMVIGGIYLPAALILRAHVRKFASRQADPEAWMAKHGLGLSLPQFLPRAIALLSPLLAGPLGELLVKGTKLLEG